MALDIVGGIDAVDDVTSRIPATEATEMEPAGVGRRIASLEATAAGAAGHGRDPAGTDSMRAGLLELSIDGHGGPPPRTLRSGLVAISVMSAAGRLRSGNSGSGFDRLRRHDGSGEPLGDPDEGEEVFTRRAQELDGRSCEQGLHRLVRLAS